MSQKPVVTIFIMVAWCFCLLWSGVFECYAENPGVSLKEGAGVAGIDSDTQSYHIITVDDSRSIMTSGDAGQEYVRLTADMSSYSVGPKEYSKEVLSYYQSIREKILIRLKRNYTKNYSDGDVYLFFVLDKKGVLSRIDVALSKSTKNENLVNTALLSLQQAAPFGPFPKDLSAPQMFFSLTITFKKESR